VQAKANSGPTHAAPDPAALRFRLGEGRAKITLPAGYRVAIAGPVSTLLGAGILFHYN